MRYRVGLLYGIADRIDVGIVRLVRFADGVPAWSERETGCFGESDVWAYPDCADYEVRAKARPSASVTVRSSTDATVFPVSMWTPCPMIVEADNPYQSTVVASSGDGDGVEVADVRAAVGSTSASAKAAAKKAATKVP